MSARWNENRKIARRIVISGKLKLLTPARFGGSQNDVVTDMPILHDADARESPSFPDHPLQEQSAPICRERLLGYEETEPRDASLLSQKLLARFSRTCLRTIAKAWRAT